MRLALGGAVAAFGAGSFISPAFAKTKHHYLGGSSPTARSSTIAMADRPLIMLDPGHGGEDPGAIAPDGVFEKHITLASALDLRQALEQTGRYRVAMTRTHDVYIPLDDRVADAMNQNASLFLSMHCDHLPDADLRGASVFTLSNDASDTLAAGLAQDENGVASLGDPMAGTSPQVADILASLETRATKIGSQSLALDLQTSFRGIVPLLPDPKRAANFAVLRDPSTPAALLEMGCLTNKLDETRLRSPAERTKLAQRITLAINSYFDNDAERRIAG
jgi:N-acetylmuramoyl-L-alanine amidase